MRYDYVRYNVLKWIVVRIFVLFRKSLLLGFFFRVLIYFYCNVINGIRDKFYIMYVVFFL